MRRGDIYHITIPSSTGNEIYKKLYADMLERVLGVKS